MIEKWAEASAVLRAKGRDAQNELCQSVQTNNTTQKHVLQRSGARQTRCAQRCTRQE